MKEDPDCQEPASAFQGLHSSWVTPQVYCHQHAAEHAFACNPASAAYFSCLWLKLGTLQMQVLAMARPWQENLLKHNIAHTLQVAGVGMILNLQVGYWTLLPIQSD